MALDDLNGIANITLDLAETKTWETASDWNAAAAEDRVIHDSYTDTVASKVQMGYAPSWLSNLVAIYPLDEDSGSTAYDYSGNALDGTINGATVGQAGGVVNTSRYSFDGTDDYVDLGSPSALQLTDDFTIAGWVEVSDLSSDRCITTWANGNWSHFPFHLVVKSSGFIRLNKSDASTNADSNTTLSTNTRYFIVVHNDANNDVRYWINGSADANNPISVEDQTNNGDTHCALSRSDNQFFSGYQNFMMFFNSALSSTQAQNLYDAVSSGYLESATKTFSSSVTPDLQNLDYTLNAQTIDLDVIGSPGTASEEIQTVTLDGGTAYTLTWTNSHADFRVRPNISSTDETTSPTMNRIELVN